MNLIHSESYDGRFHRYSNPQADQTLRGGVVTTGELTVQLAECAIDPDFFCDLDLVPPDLLARLHQIAEHAPAHPEDCLIVESCNASRGFNYGAHERARRETAYWSARLLREHFFPGLPLPPFEPLKLAGVVDDAIEMDGSVVIFGVINSYLIRKNPIHLISPDRPSIITSVSRMAYVRRDADLGSSDYLRRRFGRHGLFLDRNVKSSANTPPNTKVWVDRTAVADLPEGVPSRGARRR